MSKEIKMQDININVSTGTMIYVDIDIFRFLYDEEIFCLTIEIANGEIYEFYKEVDLLEDEVIVNHDDLERFALNWIFDNVEIVKEAPEVLAQEQSKKFITDYGSGNFKFIKLFNNKKLYDEVLKANKNNIGLILTPEVLKMSQINSIEQIFMIGVLKDR